MASVSLLKSSLVVDKYEWAKSQPHRLPSATAFRCNSFADEVVKNMVSPSPRFFCSLPLSSLLLLLFNPKDMKLNCRLD